MTKDHLRDYATAAFRYYARCGFPTYEELRDIIYNAALEESRRELVRVQGIGDPTQWAVINAEKAVDARAGELLDILAVETAMKTMPPDWRKAVEHVYFPDPRRDLEKGDIEMRVCKAGIEIPASRNTIYRWLRKARETFSRERALRMKS